MTGCPGSSPLSRGILVRACEKLRQLRIIPALAGNTQNDRSTREGCQDHPRSRGEYSVLGAMSPTGFGSSPLSRGIPPIGGEDTQLVRIIPALAGNTWRSGAVTTVIWDHPRSRGEYHRIMDPRELPLGSSPLSRGIRDED